MKIGIVNSDNSEELSETINIFETKYLLNNSDLDGTYDIIIISVSIEKDILSAIDWLIAINSYKSIFSIIIISDSLTNSISIFLKIGANQVIKKSEMSLLMVKNVIYTLDAIKNSFDRKNGLNTDSRSITMDGNEQYLTNTEYKIFNFLHKNKNKVVSYERISKEIWPNKLEKNKAIIANIIFNLRKKIKGSNNYTIKTIRSKGYILTD